MKKLLAILMICAAGTAMAQTWQELRGAFPLLPCQDGWAGCLVDGRRIDADMISDSQGFPMPAQQRFAWFDLAPTPAFSPFVGLSSYPQGEPGETAQRARGRGSDGAAPGRAQPARGNDAIADLAESGRPGQAQTRSRGAPSSALEQNARTNTEPRDSPPASPGAGAGDGSPQPQEQPEEATVSSVPSAQAQQNAYPVGSPQASKASAQDEARSLERLMQPVQQEPAASGAEQASTATTTEPSPARAEPRQAAGTDAVSMAPTSSSSQVLCDDLVALEPAALMGQLSVAVRECLESSLASAARQTDKDKMSRVLLMDSEARGDRKTWARLMKRHLEDIDRSDPDLCFKYAIYLSRRGVGRAHGVIRWADYALENKANWTGSTYTSRFYALLKLRAEAANRLWKAAEESYVQNRDDEAETEADRYRGITKDYAREWLDYARASGQDTKNAMALCVSAAGSRQFCEGG